MITIWSIIGLFMVMLTFLITFEVFSSQEFVSFVLEPFPNLVRQPGIDEKVPTVRGSLITAIIATMFFATVYILVANIL
jgi:hypothetical protein